MKKHVHVRAKAARVREKLVFCFQNCFDLLREKIVLAMEKNFRNSRLKAKYLRSQEQFIQTVKGQHNFCKLNTFLTYSWRFLISNKLEQLNTNWNFGGDLETCRKS